ncbi:hypothetical protein [Amedibacterium intestinale]|uniref:hypothetical protein n=1 Tax=Amedibacterium intestinale TaxID=2583452 RepID=UPI000E201A0F
MKLTNGTIFNAQIALNKLSNADLPIKTAYAVKKNVDALKKQIAFISERRNELIRKYGKEDMIDKEDKEAIEKFVNDFNEILGIEEEIEISTIDVEKLEDVKISASDLEALSFMIAEKKNKQ